MIRQALAGLVDCAYGVGWWAHALTAGRQRAEIEQGHSPDQSLVVEDDDLERHPLEIGTECIAGDKGDPASRTGLFEPVQFDRERAGVTGRDRHCHQGRNDGSHRCRQPGPECDPARHHRNHQPRALASENLNVLPRAASLWRNSLYWVSKTFSTPKRASQPLNSP